ncbi:MAG: hypothetical protein KIT36_16180, partial [Alphaproteobacteria bacterium]|nr:hypothetical protein [Alphaproteobacteria bacterium]
MVADSDTAGTVGAAPHAAAPASGAERMAAIEALIAGPESARYWDDPALQHEYRTLLAARDDDPRRDAARDAPAMA